MTAAITVTAVNDAPEITSQSTFTVAEDTDYSINWLSINDVDASGDDLTLELSVLEGTLTFASLAGVSLNSGNNGESEIELAGTIAEINAVLAGLKYRADSHYNGNDTLSITLTDNEGSEVDTSVAITVTAVNDKPTFNAPANVSVAEDDAVKLTGLSITDLDANEVGGEISITLGVTSGILTFVDLSSLTLLNGTANSSSSIELRGTLANINAALGDLYYQGNLNFNGSDTLALTVNDLANHGSSGALTDSANVGISVTPVNDRPTLDSPAGISLDEDSAIKVDGLAINDVEAGDLSVSISVSEGTLIFRTLTGLSITSGANFTNSVELRGTAAGLNVALGDLFYQGNLHFNGTDSLEVEVNDLGNGGGVALSNAASVTITVLAQNDAPVLTLPGSQTVDEDTTLQITGISVADVDVDEGTGQLSVSLSVANGTLDVTDLSGITISSGSNNSSALTLTGSLADLNNALANLFYLGDSNFNGSDSLVVGVKDLGNTGGSALIDNGAVGISVTPVADTPFLSVVEISGSQGQTQRLVIEAEAGAENEILSVIISGLPGGSSLSAGSLVGTSWILSSADLPGLTLTLPDKFAADFEAQVTALSIDGLSIAGVTQSLTASIDPVFVTPNDNGNSDNNDIDSQGVIIDPVFDSFNFDANSLNFLEAGSSLQFNQDFLSEDALGVIANLFNFNLSINTEVADSGIIDQEVADIKVYDLSPLTEGEQSFILDLVQNVETDEEVDTVEEEEEDSFSVESAALQELSIKNIMEDTITQDYLDTRLSLEDTLQGEFDCLINDTLVK